MSKVIKAFPFPTSTDFSIDMPDDSDILDIQNERGRPVIYALVDEDAKDVPRHFQVFIVDEQFNLERYNYTYLKTLRIEPPEEGLPTITIHIFETYNLKPSE